MRRQQARWHLRTGLLFSLATAAAMIPTGRATQAQQAVSSTPPSTTQPPQPAQTQTCSAGVTGAGTCVKSGVATAIQQRTVILTQPSLSWTGLPQAQDVPSTLDPAQDRQQSLKNQLTATAPAVSGGTSGASGTAGTSGAFVPLPAGVSPSSLNIPGGFTVVPGGIRLK